MSDEKKYYWIKLKTNFFSRDEIDFLMSQKNGCEYVVLYQMLCLKAANTDGQLLTKIGDIIVPYDVNKIVRDTKYFTFDTVTVAMELFKRLGLIYTTDDNITAISDFNSMVGSETVYAEKKREYRKKMKQAQLEMKDKKEDNVRDNVRDNVTDNKEDNVRQEIRDKSIEYRDIEYREEDIKTAEKSACPSPSDIINLFNDICKSYPKVRSLSEERKKAVKARLRTYGIDKIKEVFRKAENSSFLKGKNNRNWTATFDWLMKDSNFAKTLDGNYDDKKQQNYQQVYASGNSDPYEV